MIACALALAVVATPGLAGAWNEPDRFRDYALGASQDEIDALLRASGSSGFVRCRTIPDPNVEGRWCNGGVNPVVPSATGGDIDGDMDFTFSDAGRLTDIYISFDEKYFTYVEEVFIKAYGKPTRVDTPTLTNKFGMRVTGRNLTWEGKWTSIASGAMV